MLKTFTAIAAFYDSDRRARIVVEAEDFADACRKAVDMVDNGEVETHVETFDPTATFIYGVVEGDADPWGGAANVPAEFSEAAALGGSERIEKRGASRADSASSVTDARLFNCCTGHAEPDWSRFTSLELAGCRDLNSTDDPAGTMIAGGQSAGAAEFFTVYGRKADGEAGAITDIEDPRDALAVAAELGMRSRLPVTVSVTLAGEGV
ncbi:hypothetical protein IMF23_00130 [Chelatococcus daeguensis]|uniref:hypothetical protein n=1 Tax=Chelatococcus daeguensis TaxID=444444 RepID=UPI0007AB500A|nr:hypothetical protein [Chelatococcus daeguensis]KZE34128.1 hypothetical protein AVW15_17595 [Chelatococcus daeguensis]MBM3081836.1 hypothetical protein [Chelatococcus daeguensis]